MYKSIFVILPFIFLFYCSCDTNKKNHNLVDNTITKNREHKAHEILDQALNLILKPGENKTDLDAALLLIIKCDSINKIMNSSEVSARTFFAYSNVYRESGNVKQGLIYIEKAIRLYKSLNNPAGLGEAYLEMVQYYYEDYNKRIELYKLADSSFVKGHLLERHAFVLKNLGDIDFARWNFQTALAYLKSAESIYDSINYRSLQGVYDLMGACYSGLGDYNNGIKYGLMAVRAAEEVRDTSLQLATIFNRLAISYYRSKKYDESIYYLQKAMPIVTKYKARNDLLAISINLNVLLLTLNRFEESLELVKQADKNYQPILTSDSVQLYTLYTIAYVSAKKYELARGCVRLLEMLVKRGNDKDPLFLRTHVALVLYFMGTHKYGQAQFYLEKNFKYYEFALTKEDLTNSYKLKYMLDSAKADFKSAFESLRIYKQKTDSTFNETKSKQLTQIQVQFETETKDQDIKIKQQKIELLVNRDKMQEAKIKKSKNARNLVIVTSAFLVMLFFIGYRVKQRHNRKLELQQEEISKQNEILKQLLLVEEKLVREKEWLVKEIHHRVKNNLQIVVSLLNTQAAHLEEGDALIAIQESRHRMQIISLLHQKLYQAETSSLIDMQVYIREVVSYLKESFSGINHLYFEQKIDAISLDISQAVPVGLILNEAITNSIKYAFPKNINGNITVSFIKGDDEHLLLAIADNGVGIAKDIVPSQGNSLGMQLMQTLSEQLDGNMKIESKEGTIVKVCFRQHVIEKTEDTSENIKDMTEIMP